MLRRCLLSIQMEIAQATNAFSTDTVGHAAKPRTRLKRWIVENKNLKEGNREEPSNKKKHSSDAKIGGNSSTPLFCIHLNKCF